MSKPATCLSVLALASLLGAVPVLAHHSFSAEFDVGKPVTLVGTVKDFEWTNPHAWLHLEVVAGDGSPQEWAVEFLGVNALIRSGMSPKTVKPGDKLTITGYAARNGTNAANASSAARSDSGETLWSSVRGE